METTPSLPNAALIRELSGTSLAYLGDAALEVLVRRYLLTLGIHQSGKLTQLALHFVKATVQSAAVDRILPLLTPEEDAIYRRGRNANGINAPKSASAVDYRRATGLEALFGYLDLTGQNVRAAELFDVAYAEAKKEIT